MSKDDYDEDVPDRTSSSERFTGDSYGRVYSRASEEAFEDAARKRAKETGIVGPDPSVLMKNRVITLEGDNAVLIVIDDTGSMGKDTLLLRDKMPMFWGNAKMYLGGSLSIVLAFVGDAFSDNWPLQMINPMIGGDLHTEMLKLHREGDGGVPWRESYNLMAYAILKNVRVKTKNKPFLIFLADEAFYERTTADEIREFVGGQAEDTDSFAIFRELKKIFHVVLIHREYDSEQHDKVILEQWAQAIGAQSIIKLKDPNAVADDALGAISLLSLVRDREEYVADMEKRGQDPKRIAEVYEALKPMSDSLALVKVDSTLDTRPGVSRKRTARSK